MRTLIIASLAFAPACLVGSGDISSTEQGGVCGDGIVNGNEQCDDGNTVSGDGCSSTCQIETTNSPHAVLNVDKTTVLSDLGVTTTVMVTATGMMDFSGDLALTVAAADSSSTAITDWTASFDSATLELAANGTASAMLTLTAMGDTAALAGNVTITATGGNATDPSTVTFGVTFNPVLDVTFADNNGVCEYPVGHGVNNPYKIKVGRQIAVFNGSATRGMVVHTDNNITGFDHEDPRSAGAAGVAANAIFATLPGAAYGPNTISLTAQTGPMNIGTFYCHDPGDTAMLTSGSSSTYPYIEATP